MKTTIEWKDISEKPESGEIILLLLKTGGDFFTIDVGGYSQSDMWYFGHFSNRISEENMKMLKGWHPLEDIIIGKESSKPRLREGAFTGREYYETYMAELGEKIDD